MRNIKKIIVGCDHAGFELKEKLIAYINKLGIGVEDKGCFSADRADYADYAHLVADAIIKEEGDFGILLCGSGNGINMSANKHKGIRSALCWNSEIAVLARQHNDANILTIPARFIQQQEAEKCIDAFIQEEFEGGRHSDRIRKIDC